MDSGVDQFLMHGGTPGGADDHDTLLNDFDADLYLGGDLPLPLPGLVSGDSRSFGESSNRDLPGSVGGNIGIGTGVSVGQTRGGVSIGSGGITAARLWSKRGVGAGAMGPNGGVPNNDGPRDHSADVPCTPLHGSHAMTHPRQFMDGDSARGSGGGRGPAGGGNASRAAQGGARAGKKRKDTAHSDPVGGDVYFGSSSGGHDRELELDDRCGERSDGTGVDFDDLDQAGIFDVENQDVVGYDPSSHGGDGDMRDGGDASTSGGGSSSTGSGAAPPAKRSRGRSADPGLSLEEQRQRQLNHRRARNRKHAKETRRRKKETIDAMQVELAMLREEKRKYWGAASGSSSSADADQSGGSSGSDEPTTTGSVVNTSDTQGDAGTGSDMVAAASTASNPSLASRDASTITRSNPMRPLSATRPTASPPPIPTAQKERWVKAAHELFTLANRCEEDASRWEPLVAPNVEFVHPITPYRSFDSSRTCSDSKADASAPNTMAVMATEAATRCTVVGTQALMNDMQSLAVALGALLGKPRHAQQAGEHPQDPSSARERTESATSVSSYDREELTTSASSDTNISESYMPSQSLLSAASCITTPTCGITLIHTFGNFYFSETGLMTPFRLASTNLRAQGLACEVSERGMLQLNFEEGRIVRIETSFDTVSCWRQIQHASRAPDLKLTPNLLKAALRPSHDARMVVHAKTMEGSSRRTITHVNTAWVSLMGHDKEVAVGASLEDLCVGAATDMSVLSRFMSDADRRRPSSMSIKLYHKDGHEMHVFVQLCPLASTPPSSSSPSSDSSSSSMGGRACEPSSPSPSQSPSQSPSPSPSYTISHLLLVMSQMKAPA